MLGYDFMRNAFAAGGLVAVMAGLVGFFLVLRGQTFAGHALAHVGFTGATGAVLLGIPPLWGLVGVTVAGGVGMGLLGDRLAGRDVSIGMVLATALGLGLLFLHFFTAYASQATALLFGNVFGVDRSTVAGLAGCAWSRSQASAPSPGRCCSRRCSRSWRKPGARRVRCRCCSWRWWRCAPPAAPRSSACSWCSP